MDMMAALLAGIEEDPGDETTWLVLADWLQDAGQDARAELTRLSVQLRRAGPVHADSEKRVRALVALGATVPLPRRRVAGLELALLPPGSFLMGSPAHEARRDPDEGPAHAVRLTRGFWLGVHPVTQGQWEAVLGRAAPGRFRGEDRPVDGVSWQQCQPFLAGLGQGFRLPTEAEWEYACRGLTATPFSFGLKAGSTSANFDGNFPYGPMPPGPWLECTAPPGSYPPNAWGLFDMHGNLWEWCQDWFDEEYYARSPANDPAGPAAGTLKVLRGGSWYSYSWSCRSAKRERFSPESGGGNHGFRVALPA